MSKFSAEKDLLMIKLSKVIFLDIVTLLKLICSTVSFDIDSSLKEDPSRL